MKKSKQSFKMGVGVSLLLIILVVISMTTLSVLALLSSVNDLKLTQKRQAYIKELALATVHFESALFTVNEANHAGDPRQASYEGVAIDWQGDTVQLTSPFHDYMAVVGVARVTDAGIERQSFEIANFAEWEADDSLDLFSGDFAFFTEGWPDDNFFEDIDE